MVEATNGTRIAPALEILAGPARLGRQAGPAGVIVAERHGAGFASLTARRGCEPALAASVLAAFAITLPPVGKRIVGNGLVLTGVGPGQWLAEAPQGPDAGMETWLRPILGTHASLVNQGHARVLLRLSGPHVRAALATGVALDLHPRAFSPGDAAQTIVAHVGVMFWQLDASPVYEFWVPRSLFGSFWSWLEHAAARHGLEIRPPLIGGGPGREHGDAPQ